MNWLILAQLIVLMVITYNASKVKSTKSLRMAWLWFTGVFFSQAFLTLFRAGNFNDPDLVLVEIWANGFIWFFLGMSTLMLPSALLGTVPGEYTGSKPAEPATPDVPTNESK